MNAPTSPLPASLLRAEADKGDLDSRILHVEQRLIAREENLRRRVNLLNQRTRLALAPKRLFAPVIGGGVALGGLWMLLRGRSAGPAPGTVGPVGGAASPAGAETQKGLQIPWVQMLGFAWPLLPAAWRSRVNPATVNTVMTIGLPMAQKLLSRSPPPPLDTVAAVDLGHLCGTWYEVAAMPAPHGGSAGGLPKWKHTLRGDGRIDWVGRRVDADGREHTIEGVATSVRGSRGVRLKVSLMPGSIRWLAPAWHDQWVLHIDHGELLLGSPGRDRLRLLSRRPTLPPARLQVMVEAARDQGYVVERLTFLDRG